MKTYRLYLIMLMLAGALTAGAQITADVSLTPAPSPQGGGGGDGASEYVDIAFSFHVDEGWHVYGPENDGGPIALTFNAETLTGAVLEGGLRTSSTPVRTRDDIFGCDVTYFDKDFTATQRLRLSGGEWKAQGYVEYGACNEATCLPPTPVEFEFEGQTGLTPDPSPKVREQSPLEGDSAAGRSLLAIFLLGALGGLIALLTPCVWPIIPMTVSFFLKRAKDDRRRGIRDAVLYGLSIIVIYVGLGLLVTLLWGPAALNALSTNAVFSIFLFLLLMVFAASFLGGFEITLPSSWSTRLDEKASATTGIVSIFLMATTLVLVSFSCTGPIVGLLLVDMVTSGSVVAPTIGMLGFALALAAPFTVFAMFPSWLKATPKSGNWMNVIKVVLGFIELAFALKFLSVADLAYGWHLLNRETFLCIWIIIFALMGFYLLGWIRLPHDEDERDGDGNVIARPRIGVTRLLAALISLAFALYMVPGLWGAPCKAVSAFAPPMWTQDFRLDPNSVEATYTDYESGMEAARRAGKPVMLDFTGYGCVNCRKMEAAVWTDARVRHIITEEYILVSLYVDDKTPLPAPIDVTEADGTPRRLRTVGDRWSYLQRTTFGAQTQPFYVLTDPDGNLLAQPYSYNEDVDAYLRWLEEGLKN